MRKRAIHEGLEDHEQVSCTAAEPSSLREVSIIRLCYCSALINVHPSFRCYIQFVGIMLWTKEVIMCHCSWIFFHKEGLMISRSIEIISWSSNWLAAQLESSKWQNDIPERISMEIFPRFDVRAWLLIHEIFPRYDVIALLLGYSWHHFLGIWWSKSVRHLVQFSISFDNLST